MLFIKSPFCQLNPEVMAKMTDMQSQIEHHDSKLAEINQELDKLKIAKTQEREQAASTRESAAVVVNDVAQLEREKEALKDEIDRKEKELKYFKKLHENVPDIFSSQREKEDLLDLIKAKERELKETNERLEKKEKKLKESKRKIQSLKKKIEEGIRKAAMNEGKFMMLEQEKVKVQTDLERERKKVEQLRMEVAIPTAPQPQVRLEI